MKLNLVSCDAQRADRSAIAHCISEISHAGTDFLSNELMDLLLEGYLVTVVVEDQNSGCALRALRKLRIDYEIVD